MSDTFCCPDFRAALDAPDGGAITNDTRGNLYICSVQNPGFAEQWHYFPIRFCPFCGARLEKGEKGES